MFVTANSYSTGLPAVASETRAVFSRSMPGSGVSGTPSVQNSTWLSPNGLSLFGFVGVTRFVSPNVSDG